MQPTISQLIEIYGHKILILKNLISFVKPVKEFAENTGIVWTDESEDLILEHHYFGKDKGLLPLIDELIELNKLVLSYEKPHQLGDLVVSHYEKMLQEIEKEQKFLGFLRRTLSEVAEHGNYGEYWKKSFVNYRNLLDVIRGDLTYLRLCRETTAKTAANWVINLIYRGDYDASFHFLDNDSTAKSLGEDGIHFFKRLLNAIKSLNLEETDAIVEEGKEVLDVDEYVLLKRVFLTRIKPSLFKLNEAARRRILPPEQGISPSPDKGLVETSMTPEQVAQQLAEEIRLWERLLERVRTSGPSIRKNYQTALETARNAYAALMALGNYLPEISRRQIVERLRKPKFVRLRDRISRIKFKDRREAMQRSMSALRESIALRNRIKDVLKSMPGISREQFLRLSAGAAAATAIAGGALWLSNRKNEEVQAPGNTQKPAVEEKPGVVGEFEPNFGPVNIPEVEKTIYTEGKYANAKYIAVIPHSTELNALNAARAAAQGPITYVAGNGERNLKIKTRTGKFEIDPNNAFCVSGVIGCFNRLNGNWAGLSREDQEQVQNSTKKFVDEVSKRIFVGKMVLALHQNYAIGTPIINDYKPKGKFADQVDSIYVSEQESPHVFAFVNSRGWFEALRLLGWNVILQKNNSDSDNGSIAYATTWRGLPYVNIEVKIGDSKLQTEKIAALNNLIDKYPDLAVDLNFVPQIGISGAIRQNLQAMHNDLKARYEINNYNYAIIVLGDYQKLYLVNGGLSGVMVHKEYDVSTGKNGFGKVPHIGQTPIGVMKIKSKIGDKAPLGAVFKNLSYPNTLTQINYNRDDNSHPLMTTRLIVLEGSEQQNRDFTLIRIHGTNKEGLIGTPDSGGCIRMRNNDVIELYDIIPKSGTYVNITPQTSNQFSNEPKLAANILFIGSDIWKGREKMGERGDSLVLISTDFNKKSIKIVTIPRDTYTNVRGTKTKINHALAWGGWKLQKAAVEEFLGISIDKVFFIDGDNLRDLVYTARNGTGNVSVIKDVYSRLGLASSLEMGFNEIFSLVSNRKFADAAVGRAKNHARIIEACIKTIIEYYNDPTKKHLFETSMINKFLSLVKYTDLTPDILLSIIKEWSNMGYSTLKCCVPGTPQNINGVSYWVAENRSGNESNFIKIVTNKRSIII